VYRASVQIYATNVALILYEMSYSQLALVNFPYRALEALHLHPASVPFTVKHPLRHLRYLPKAALLLRAIEVQCIASHSVRVTNTLCMACMTVVSAVTPSCVCVSIRHCLRDIICLNASALKLCFTRHRLRQSVPPVAG
jgi:hypothetical protein